MLHTLDVLGANGVPFRVLAIPASEEGPNQRRAPAHRRYPLVEFYDRRYDHEPDLGQFTGGYYALEALRENRPHGLDLAGHVDDWTVDGDTMALVMGWLNRLDAAGVLD